jgi:hypothetical protein
MKSYWIVATVVLLAVWPSSSQAYVAGLSQSKAEDSQVQQTQPSNSSSIPEASSATQAPPITANTTASTKKPETKSAANAASQSSTYILVELNKSLKAKKLKPGDKVKATVSQDVLSHGKIIIPMDTELVGHVTEVRVRDDANTESRVGIVFDTIQLKHFHDINCKAVIQAVAAPAVRRSLVDEPSQMLPPSLSAGGGGGASTAGGSRGALGGRSPLVSPSAPPAASDPTSFQVPVSVKDSPTANAAGGSAAAQLDPASGSSGKPMSVGMPQGVTGLKGLSLSSTPSADTPGPVIVSNTGDVKLESGTQMLLHVISVETTQK